MAPAEDSCPSGEALFRAIEGLLEPAKRALLDEHIDRCSECRAALTALAQLRSWSECRQESGSAGADASMSNSSVVPGDRLGAYEIIGLLGRGGMGAVFEAYDPRLDRRVAIKVVLPRLISAGSHQRLFAEARGLARIAHPNVVTVHEVEEFGESVYLVMERVKGVALGEWIAAEERSLGDILGVLAGVARGLLAAHLGGVAHLDVKPSNIVVGDDGRPRLIDFGLSRGPSFAVEAKQGGGGRRLLGTPAYMAPEQFDLGTADARSDVFALALTAYEVLHRRRPFGHRSGKSIEAQIAVIEAGPRGRWRSDLGADLRRLLSESLAVDPAARPSVLALARGFERRKGRQRWRWVASIGFGVFCGAAAAFLGLRERALGDPACDHERVSAQLEHTWGDGPRAELRARYASSMPSDAERVVADIEVQLDQRIDHWRALHREFCSLPADLEIEGDGTRKSGQAEEKIEVRRRAERLACLDLRLAEVDGLVELLLRGDPALLSLAPRFLHELRDLDHCRDPAAGGVESTLPESGQGRAQVMALRALLVQSRMLGDVGQDEMARKRAIEALQRAEALDNPALIAEAQLILGISHPEERARVEEAAFMAERVGARRIYAFAAIAHAAHMGLEGDDLAGAQIWMEHALATLPSLGEDPEVEGLYAWIEGALLVRHGRLAQAKPALIRAVELYRGAHGDDALIVVTQPLRTLAAVERGLGEPEQALAIVDQALQTIEARLGGASPLLLSFRLDRAAVLIDLGRFVEATAEHARVEPALNEPEAAAEFGRLYAEERLRLAEALHDRAFAAEAAKALAAAAGAKGDELGEALARCTRAHYLLELGQETAALEELKEAGALEERIYTAHELAGRDEHRRLIALLREAYRKAGVDTEGAGFEAREDTLRIRVQREFSVDGFAGAEVCLERASQRRCLIADDDGQVLFALNVGGDRDDITRVRVTGSGVLPTLLLLGGQLGGAHQKVTLYRAATIEGIARHLGIDLQPSDGFLLTGIEGSYVEGIAGGVLHLGTDSGYGPYYLTPLGGFDRDRRATTTNSRGGVGWLGLSVGRYEVWAEHPSRHCRVATEARAGVAEASAVIEIEPGVISQVPDFRCATPPRLVGLGGAAPR